METIFLRLLRTLGAHTSFELVDGAQLADAPWWATDALRSVGFVPAAAVRVKPLLMPVAAAFDRYVGLWHADVEAMRRLSGPQLRAMDAISDDGGPLRWVALADQPGIAERLDAVVGSR